MKDREFVNESEFEVAIADLRKAAGRAVLRQVGFDVAEPGEKGMRFIEVKVYKGARLGSIGFGTPTGSGPQVAVLGAEPKILAALDRVVVWAFADLTRPVGSARYALLTSTQAAKLVRGVAESGKQNNLSIARLKDHWTDWDGFKNALAAMMN